MNNDFEVFISFKNANDDVEIADTIYKRLSSKNIKCFFSNDTILKIGKSDYLDLIDSALNTSKILILIASSKENVTSEFIKHEWKSFLNELYSNRKKGELFVLLNGMETYELPYALRDRQNYYKNDLDKLIDIVINALSLPTEANNTTLLSVSEFNNSNFTKQFSTNHMRKCLDVYVSNFIISDSKLCFLIAEYCIGATDFIEQYVLKFRNDNSIIYSNSVERLKTFISNQKDVMDNIKLIFIDNISSHDDISYMIGLLNQFSNIKIVSIIPLHLENDLYKYTEGISFSIYKIPFLSRNEIKEMFNKAFNSNEEMPFRVCELICNLQIDYIKKPYFINIYISAIKANRLSISNFSLPYILELIEVNKDLLEKEVDILKYLIRNKTYHIPLDNNELENSIKLLSDFGLIVRYQNYYVYRNESIIKYKISKLLFQNNPLDKKFELFSGLFEDCIPIYISYAYSNSIRLTEFDYSKLSINNLFNVINCVVINEKGLLDVVNIKEIKEYILDYVLRNIENGYYQNSRMIIDTLDNYNLVDKDDINVLNLTYDYYYYGIIKISDKKNLRSLFYNAQMFYYTDQYKESLKLYKRIFKKKMNPVMHSDAYLNYLDVLVDAGYAKKIGRLIDRNSNIKLSIQQLGHQKNIEGYVLTSDGKYLEAINKYFESIELLKKDEQDNMLAKDYGDIAIVYIYLGKLDEAEKYAKKNLFICTNNGNYHGLCAANQILARINFLNRDYISAYKYLYLSLMYSQYTGNKWREVRIKLYLNILNQFTGLPKYNVNNLLMEINDIKSDEFWPFSYTLMAIDFVETDICKSKVLLDKCNGYIQYTNEKENRNIFYMVNSYLKKDNKKYSLFSSEMQKSYFEFKQLPKKFFENYVPYREFFCDDLELLKPSTEYCNDIFDYSSDYETTRFMLWNAHVTINDTLNYIEMCIDKMNDDNYLAWVIVKDGKAIGMIDFTYNEELLGYEIGYILSRNFWRQGIMTKVAKIIISHFKEMHQKKIIGVVFSNNIPSKKTLIKLGFKYIGSRENCDAITENMYELELC